MSTLTRDVKWSAALPMRRALGRGEGGELDAVEGGGGGVAKKNVQEKGVRFVFTSFLPPLPSPHPSPPSFPFPLPRAFVKPGVGTNF